MVSLVSGLMPQSWATCGSSPWERSSHKGNSHTLTQKMTVECNLSGEFSGVLSMHARWAAQTPDISTGSLLPVEIKFICGCSPSVLGIGHENRSFTSFFYPPEIRALLVEFSIYNPPLKSRVISYLHSGHPISVFLFYTQNVLTDQTNSCVLRWELF